MKYVALALLLALACATADDTIVLPSLHKGTGPAVALIFYHGALMPNTQYLSLFKNLQQQSNLDLWVLLPGFALDTPNPVTIHQATSDALATAHQGGLPKDAPLFFGGHSLGSIMSQNFVATLASVEPTWQIAGQILTGGYLGRNYIAPQLTYTVPTLTIGGELDGLSRVTRIVESFYQMSKQRVSTSQFPVVVLPGVSHYQFAGEGPVPELLKLRDLQPEVSQAQAWSLIIALFSDFMNVQVHVAGAGQALASAVAQTGKFAAPLIAAYELEGSRHFNAPNQIGGPGESNCVKGGCPDHSNWVHTAQEVIGAQLPNGFTVQASNEYVDCSSTPITGEEFHLPNVTVQDKVLHVTTYTQAKWELLDKEDTGFAYTSASELGTKLYSRQCLLINGVGLPNTTSFDVDAPQFCAMTNELAYKWALANAGAPTATRYAQYGQQFVFGDDVPEGAGPLFLLSPLRFDDQVTADGKHVVNVTAPMQKTEIDYWINHFHIPRPSWIPDPGCFHYCKLLSPARAMEWLYVDSLRLNRHI